jgi:ketosteroid isomerase-like protein
LLFLTVPIPHRSPHPADDNYQSLVSAERAFAAYGREHSIKDAFAKFLSEAYIFRQNKFVLGGPFYASQPEGPGRLTWRPAYARVAASGNWGYTTGPSEYHATIATDPPAGYGDFVSIWQKTPSGTWQVVFDGGTSHAAPTKPAPEIAAAPITKPTTTAADTASTRRSLQQTEAAFATRALQSLSAAYAPVLVPGPELRLLREGAETYVGEAAATLAGASKQAVSFRPFRAGVAPSGELGYTLGYLDYQGKQGHYLRLWHRQGKRWMLDLELLAADLK